MLPGADSVLSWGKIVKKPLSIVPVRDSKTHRGKASEKKERKTI